MKTVEQQIESMIFASRWLLAPLFIGLIFAIVAISAVELLKAFLVVAQHTNEQLAWKVGIHLTFVVSGVLFAVTDRLVEGTKNQAAHGG